MEETGKYRLSIWKRELQGVTNQNPYSKFLLSPQRAIVEVC